MRLAVRTPFAGSALLGFLALRAIPGVEATGPGWYARTLALPHGAGTVRLDVPDAPTAGETAFVTATFALDDLRDTAAAVERTRRMLDADCDPVAVADAFAGDPVVGPLVRRNPGLRVPGPRRRQRDRGPRGARPAGQRRRRADRRRPAGPGSTGVPLRQERQPAGLTHLFPDPATIAGLDPRDLPMPRARGRALVALCAALADGDDRARPWRRPR